MATAKKQNATDKRIVAAAQVRSLVKKHLRAHPGEAFTAKYLLKLPQIKAAVQGIYGREQLVADALHTLAENRDIAGRSDGSYGAQGQPARVDNPLARYDQAAFLGQLVQSMKIDPVTGKMSMRMGPYLLEISSVTPA